MDWPQSISSEGSPAQRFLKTWEQSEQPPDVFEFLHNDKRIVVDQWIDVLRVDQIMRWRQGCAFPVERYFEQCPEVGTNLTWKYELVFAELRLFRRCWLAEQGDPQVLRELAESTKQEEDHRATVLSTGLATSAPSGTETATHFRSFFREFLPKCRPFESLPPVVIELIAAYMKRVTFPRGSKLLEQGDPGEHLLVLVKGSVVIQVTDEKNQSHVIDTDQAPTILGEMSLLTQEPRGATVTATSPVEAGILPAHEFRQLRGKYPILGTVLTNLLADRIGNKWLDALGSHTLSGYRIQQKVGSGGMAIVYKATHVETGNVVALKMLSHRRIYDQHHVTAFQEEARTLAQLQNPHIARVHKWFPAFETYFLAMDYCDGITLSQFVRATGALPDEIIRRVLGGIASGLCAAHSKEIIHRDLKPGNVMISRSGHVLLMDFGLAKSVADSDASEDRRIMGTPRYMAPEQHSTAEVDKHCDYYALGCVLMEMITGRPLFTMSNAWELLTAKMLYELPALSAIRSGLSPDLYDILKKTLHKSPNRRTIDLFQVSQWSGQVDPQLLERAMRAYTKKP